MKVSEPDCSGVQAKADLKHQRQKERDRADADAEARAADDADAEGRDFKSASCSTG